MKKKLTLVFVLVMVFVMMFTIVGCDKNGDNENPGETTSTAESNTQLITDALDAVLGAEDVHISIDDINMVVSVGMEQNFGGSMDIYLRKSETGYDFAMDMNIITKIPMEEEELDKTYTSVSVESYHVVYAQGYLNAMILYIAQDIVDGAGYASFDDYVSDPENKDAMLIETEDVDWEKAEQLVDEYGNSRVKTTLECRKANSLDTLVDYMVANADFLKGWGWTTTDKLIEVAKSLLGEVATLAKGENEADENGNRTIALNIDAKEIFNKISGAINANMEKPLGELVKALTEKDQAFVTDVVNRLFPAEGSCLTINEFIGELEKILAENDIIFSLKSVLDSVQEASGLTTQQIADALNPFLKSVLPENTSVSINPREGETLYDTLERSAFDMLGVDTFLSIIDLGNEGGSSDEPSTEHAGPLTSATLNEKLLTAMYDQENSMTFIEAVDSFEFFETLASLAGYSADNLKADVNFNFDKDNKLTSIDAFADIVLSTILPEDVELPEGFEMPKTVIKIDTAAVVTYEANDDKYSLDAFNMQDKTYTLPDELAETTYYYGDKILEALGVEVEKSEDVRMNVSQIILVDKNGFVSECPSVTVSSNGGSDYVRFDKLPTDYAEMYWSINYDDVCYIVRILPPAAQG